MQEEYDSLMTNNTWTLVPLPASRKPVSCKWVFKIKQGANGEVEHYKARLVARGFT
jgi:histone deacetylase 1/2